MIKFFFLQDKILPRKSIGGAIARQSQETIAMKLTGLPRMHKASVERRCGAVRRRRPVPRRGVQPDRVPARRPLGVGSSCCG